MKTSRNVRSIVVFSTILTGVVGAFVACSSSGGDGNLNGYDPNHPPGPTGEGGTMGGGEGGGGTPGVDPAEALYRGLEKDLVTKCGGPGGGCHVSATSFSTAPKFLATPDSYKSIKGYTGIVVKDVFSSVIITKGVHEGGSIYDDGNVDAGSSLGKRVEAWLYQESAELQAIKRPTTDAFSVTIGADNDVDLSKLATGVMGVHLKFKAQMVGTTLELTNMALTTAAGSGVHLQHPIFFRVPAKKANPADPDTQDPQDTFSNTDLTVGGGATTPFPVPFAIFSGFDPYATTDKLRIEAYKLEPGILKEAATVAMCTSPALFQSMVAPELTGAGSSAPLNCLNCHNTGGSGNGALNLSGLGNTKDYPGACVAVMNKIDTATPANSRIIQKLNGTLSHAGGAVTNKAGWTADWTGFINGKAIF